MADEEYASLVRRVFHEGRSTPNPPPILEELFAPTFVCHGPPGMEHTHEGGAQGPETCIFRNAFERLAFAVYEITVDRERVVARFSAQRSQIAEFQGVPPSDEEVAVTGIVTFRIEDRKIAEGWGSLNWSR